MLLLNKSGSNPLSSNAAYLLLPYIQFLFIYGRVPTKIMRGEVSASYFSSS